MRKSNLPHPLLLVFAGLILCCCITSLLAFQTTIGFKQLPSQVQYASASFNQTIGGDQAFQVHVMRFVSTFNGNASGSGVNYQATGLLPPVSQPLPSYTDGELFVVELDVPQLPGATLDIDNVGPILLVGNCNSQLCIVIYQEATSTSAATFQVR